MSQLNVPSPRTPIDFPTHIQLAMTGKPTLGEYILNSESAGFTAPMKFESKDELLRILTAIRLAAKIVAREITMGDMSGNMSGLAGHQNVQGEDATKLDVFANDLFVQCLRNRNICCGLVSEEEDEVISFNQAKDEVLGNKYIVLMDPLDGSSNIDVNVPVGTIFSVLRRKSDESGPVKISDFLQEGNSIIAAGYVVYGSCTMLVMSTGNGVHGFTLDPSIGTLYLTHPNMRFPDPLKHKSANKIYSVNEGNYDDFSIGVREYLNECRRKRMSARYVGSLVADFHRNLLKGGLYFYPPTTKAKNGKLRLLYEVAPMSFLAEQAGGRAISGAGKRVLDIVPTEIHQRVPCFVGPGEMVDEIEKFMKDHD